MVKTLTYVCIFAPTRHLLGFRKTPICTSSVTQYSPGILLKDTNAVSVWQGSFAPPKDFTVVGRLDWGKLAGLGTAGYSVTGKLSLDIVEPSFRIRQPGAQTVEALHLSSLVVTNNDMDISAKSLTGCVQRLANEITRGLMPRVSLPQVR